MGTSLKGSTALVTGATSGIGRAIALQLAGAGADVVVHGRNPERGTQTVREIENTWGKARFVAADLSRPDEVRRLADECQARSSTPTATPAAPGWSWTSTGRFCLA